MRISFHLFFLTALLTLSACQTSMLKQFSKVQQGMEKDDVLEVMGSPNQSQRFHGKDRWRYVFYEDQIRFEKEVHFFEGKAIYAGDIWQPDPSRTAVAVYKYHEELNQKLDIQNRKDIEEYRKAYDKYESQTRGEDKVRYVPTFKPIR
jgi:outer membrane protein assembly factor BamE